MWHTYTIFIRQSRNTCLHTTWTSLVGRSCSGRDLSWAETDQPHDRTSLECAGCTAKCCIKVTGFCDIGAEMCIGYILSRVDRTLDLTGVQRRVPGWRLTCGWVCAPGRCRLHAARHQLRWRCMACQWPWGVLERAEIGSSRVFLKPADETWLCQHPAEHRLAMAVAMSLSNTLTGCGATAAWLTVLDNKPLQQGYIQMWSVRSFAGSMYLVVTLVAASSMALPSQSSEAPGCSV
jgi:hypothetical protein